MITINANPPEELIRVFGALAYVSEYEREAYKALPTKWERDRRLQNITKALKKRGIRL